MFETLAPGIGRRKPGGEAGAVWRSEPHATCPQYGQEAHLASSTAKKVVVYRYERESLRGYLSLPSGLGAEGIELLSPSGAVSVILYPEVKVVSFVKDFEGTPLFQERLLFHNRPKVEGLWVRAQFRDNDFLEGVMPNDLLWIETKGFTVIPPDPDSNSQRLFLPRASLKALHVRGVIGASRRRMRKPSTDKQIELFG